MIARDDLRAAVGSGLLTEKQAADLVSLADSRRGARENLLPGDEPFELFKGFNEIFIVIGLIILATGWVSVTALTLGNDIINLRGYAVSVTVMAAGILWMLSEYFVRKRRMIAPAIALAVMFGINPIIGFLALLGEPFMIVQGDYFSATLPVLLTTLVLLIYWWRFRVPIAMAMIAIGLFIAATVLAASQGGEVRDISDLFLLSAGGPFAWITLVLGVLVFAVAMAFDMSDPHRVTRRSANGFWLHVVAAPALVNTVALSLLDQGTAGANIVLLGFLALFAVVAIVIDRRSFLIAAIGYIVTLAATVLNGDGAALTVLFLGIALLLLGAFWERIRARVLGLLPGIVPLHRLPPSQV
ncbi:hypothetical protein [Yoonia sp.]|uniref:hypothetical protein n=1 Tax=Yoonia sp. TaxID=2212373 RepID=UPI0025CF7767|nr:hypothetical protein [Yoonia sp.]